MDYGDRAEHCWNGDHTRPNAISRLRYHQMFVPKMWSGYLKSALPARTFELAILTGRARECGGPVAPDSSCDGEREVPFAFS